MKRTFFLISLTLVLNLIFNDVLLGQSTIRKSKQTIPITDPNYLNRNDVFLISNFDSIAQVLHVYAYNSTDTTTFLNTYERNGTSVFNLLIKNTSGEWAGMGKYPVYYPFLDYQMYYAYHNPERTKRSIPPNSYVRKSYSFGNRKTDFKTKLKLSITVNKKEIKMRPIEVTLDRSQALGMEETIIKNIDLCLSGKEKTSFNRKELILDKAKYLYDLEKKEEAFALMSKVWNDDAEMDSDKVLYLKVKLLLSLAKEKKYSEAEKYLFRNAAMTAFYKMNSSRRAYFFNKEKSKITWYFHKFRKRLPYRFEWDTINDLDCLEEGNQYYCFEKNIIKDYVMVRYAENPVVLDTLPPLTLQKEAVFQVVEEFYIPDLPECEGISGTKLRKTCFDKILMEHIYKHLKYPDLAAEHKIEGTVVLTMKIDPDNKIYCAKRLRDIGGGTGEAALTALNLSLQELFKDYKPCKWKPSKARGQPASVQWNIPVKFKLKNKD